jgi:hypothetical protein
LLWQSEDLCVSHFSLMQDFVAALLQKAQEAKEVPHLGK